MTKRVQIIGHDSATANAFTGLDREITVDYQNWELRLHDGYTPGGRKILNRDQNDNRYQPRNVELDGLLGWDPSERGIVTRLGPGNYALRVVQVEASVFEITNPTGFEGNFQIALKSDVSKNITFSGTINYTQEVTFSDGLTGNLTGNVTGDLTGDSTGEHTGDVIGDVLGNTFGTHTGSLDTRTGTVEMAAKQLQLAWLGDDIINFILAKVVPIGGCIPYFGEVADIPLNWALCDGSNGTPNLTNGRGVVGVGADFPLGSSGGSVTHQHNLNVASGGAHVHGGTATGHALTESELPQHRHKAGVVDKNDSIFCYGSTAAEPTKGSSIDGNSSSGILQPWTSYVGSNDPHTHGLDVSSAGAHVHGGDTSQSSSLSPYVAGNWIMRLS